MGNTFRNKSFTEQTQALYELFQAITDLDDEHRKGLQETGSRHSSAAESFLKSAALSMDRKFREIRAQLDELRFRISITPRIESASDPSKRVDQVFISRAEIEALERALAVTEEHFAQVYRRIVIGFSDAQDDIYGVHEDSVDSRGQRGLRRSLVRPAIIRFALVISLFLPFVYIFNKSDKFRDVLLIACASAFLFYAATEIVTFLVAKRSGESRT